MYRKIETKVDGALTSVRSSYPRSIDKKSLTGKGTEERGWNKEGSIKRDGRVDLPNT